MSLELVRALGADLTRLEALVVRTKTVEVSSEGLRAPARAVVDRYFRSVRQAIVSGVPASVLSATDLALQDLLRATQHRIRRQAYRGLVKSVVGNLRQVEEALLIPIHAPEHGSLDSADIQITATLKSLVPSAALSYQQALVDLRAEERLSWRGPATDLREALRETLDHLAPDTDVEAMPGFKREPDTRGPTAKQKVRYVLSRRGVSRSASETSERAVEGVEAAFGSFVRSVYTRSNVSTHTVTSKAEVMRVLELVRVCLRELLELR